MNDRGEHVDEDRLNISVRKFLKEVGVTSQRAIEKTVRDADAGGRMGNGSFLAKVTLEVPELGLVHIVEGRIETE